MSRTPGDLDSDDMAVGHITVTDANPTLLVYVAEFLPPTMTFAYRQLLGVAERWSPVAVTTGIRNRALFPYSSLKTLPHTALTRNRERYYNRVMQGSVASIWGKRAQLLQAIVHDVQPRLMHAHFGRGGLELLPFAKRHGIPLLVTFHGYDASAMLRRQGYRRQLRALFDYAHIITVSRDMADRLVALGADRSRLTVHYIGAPLEIFEFVDRRPPGEKLAAGKQVEFLQVSGFVEKKGHEYTLAAFRRLLKDYPNCRLTFAGAGALRPRIESMSSSLVHQGRVRFLGGLVEADVAQALGQADVFLHHSVTSATGDMEGIPTGLMEAMATGLPVISTHHSGIPELVDDGTNGYLVAERDVAGYVEALRRVIHSGREMGQAARHKVEAHFDMEKQNQVLCDIYDEVSGADTAPDTPSLPPTERG